MASIIAMRAAVCGVTPDAPSRNKRTRVFRQHTLPTTRDVRRRFCFKRLAISYWLLAFPLVKVERRKKQLADGLTEKS
jgi:hypothetical protein